MSKYQKLANYLAEISEDQIAMSFAEVETALGSKLPPVAFNSNAFWANSKTDDSHTWSHLWQLAGWYTSNVDIPGQKLVFRRIAGSTELFNPSPKQLRILSYLSKVDGWTTRKQMEEATGAKGFSMALGAPTQKAPVAGTLEAAKLVKREAGPAPFKYRITALGRHLLGELGTSVVPDRLLHTALVLTENEVYAGEDFGWDDQTGKQYQFPNRYKAMIVPGATFVYYKGKRRANGNSVPEYYGHGVIGDVQLSEGSESAPPGKRKWTAQIERWMPFDEPVPFKVEDGTYIETGTLDVASNYWRDGVREISRTRFLEILLSGGATPVKGTPAAQLIEDSGELQMSDKPLITFKKQYSETAEGNRKERPRRSKQATVIGRAAEELFYQMLLKDLPHADREKIRWIANEGITPGYDIRDDRDPLGIVAYEVKGTTGARFSSVEITANELTCAHKLGAQYALVLVTGVGTLTPKCQILKNPSKSIEQKEAIVIPTTFSFAFCADQK